MSYCFNPNCVRPNNTTSDHFCRNCGARLRLQDRYRALQVIVEGGFGIAYLAIDEAKPSKPQCFIKQFNPQGMVNIPKAIQLFQQEAERLEQLGNHQQIPTLHAHFEQNGRHYIIQDYIPGINLDQEVRQRGAFKEDEIWQLLTQILPVLEFIHRAHVIHRDIKPENIIRRPNGQLVLVDFGAAKYALGKALAQVGTIIGSSEYTPPEQTAGKATFASDLYSLGVTCLVLMTLTSPFKLYHFIEMEWQWQHYLAGRRISNELGRILNRLVAKALNDRYQTAEQVLQDLQMGLMFLTPPLVQSSPPPHHPSILVHPISQLSQHKNLNFNLPRNGGQLELMMVPGGTLIMGGHHRIELQTFWISKYLITQRQYQGVMGKNFSYFQGDLDYPVDSVSWNDAHIFCQILSKILNVPIDLPSEAQWEWAARGSILSRGFEYSGSNCLEEVGWYNENSGKIIHPVGQKKPNELGLYDMSGNVWEWCKDYWVNEVRRLPQDGSSHVNRDNKRTQRGGSWNLFARNARSVNRAGVNQGSRYNYFGFRVVHIPLI